MASGITFDTLLLGLAMLGFGIAAVGLTISSAQAETIQPILQFSVADALPEDGTPETLDGNSECVITFDDKITLRGFKDSGPGHAAAVGDPSTFWADVDELDPSFVVVPICWTVWQPS